MTINRFQVLSSAVLGCWFSVLASGVLAQPPPPAAARTRTASYELTDGRTLEGVFLNHERADDIQLRTKSGSIVLLRKSGDRYRIVTSGVDWPSYDGSTTGNRYTTLTEIDKSNVGRLAPKWIYTIPTSLRLQVTPVVVDGIMYVTSANECYALDAGIGPRDLALSAAAHERSRRRCRRRHQPRCRGRGRSRLHGDRSCAAAGAEPVHRRPAVGHRDGRLAAELRRDVGAAGCRRPRRLRHCPAASRACAGFSPPSIRPRARRSWRFWTVPQPGEPGSETWSGKDIEQPGGATWLTGVYDAALDTAVLDDWQSVSRLQRRRAAGRQPVLELRRRARPGNGRCNGTFSSRRTTSGTGTRSSRPCSSTRRGKDVRASCSSRPTATASSTSSIAPTAISAAKPFVNHLTWAQRDRRRRPAVLMPGRCRHPKARVSVRRRMARPIGTRRHSARRRALLRADARELQRVRQELSEWAAGKSYWGGSTRPAPEAPNQKILRAMR